MAVGPHLVVHLPATAKVRGRGGLLTSAVKASLLRVLVPAAVRVTQNARRICAALGLKGNPSYRSLQHWTVVSFQPKV